MAFRVFANPNFGTPVLAPLTDAGFRQAKAEISSWPGYAFTPLRDLAAVARQADLAAIRLKDEAGRYAVGSGVAVERARRGDTAGPIVVTCATDGNHGRAVAWGAQRFRCGCVIFVHETVSPGRVDAIAQYGAEVRRVPGTYDDAVREASRQAEANGWFVVSDTSWDGYTDVPRLVMQGYRLMADEAADQWDGAPPTHVFIQGGVGGVAAAVSVHIRARLQPTPALIVVEPDRAACLLASAELGELTTIPGNLDTLMAGLACGEPSRIAWEELDQGASAFMAVPDEAAVACMRLLADEGIVGGESGVAGLAGCLLAAADRAARETLGLDSTSRVLVFNTEGATDPALYQQLVGRPANQVGR
jgi:diaminopropionate ammonia-lyase